MLFYIKAIFRLCRIVYPTFLWLVDIRTYLVIIPFMWMFSFALLSPVHISQVFLIIPGEYICRLPKTETFFIIYTTTVVYGLPFVGLALIYIQLHRFLRRRTFSSHYEFQFRSRRGQRDMFVFRRITIMVTVLGSYGMPCCVMLIIFGITGKLVSCFYRVLELSIAACVLTLSLTIFYVTPQLRKTLRHHSKTTNIKAIPTCQRSSFRKQTRSITQNL